MVNESKPVVAHYKNSYLGLTETFIYTYITHHRKFRPIILTTKAYNLEYFPFTPIYSLPEKTFTRFTWSWLSRSLRTRILGIYPFERIITKNRVGVLHAHFGPGGVYLLPIKRKLGLPLVTSFYGYDAFKFGSHTEWRVKYGELFATGDLFLVEGPYLRKQLIKLGCSPDKIAIQRIALDLREYQFMPRCLPKNGGKVRILLCGRFVEKKGIIYALEALSIALQYYDNIVLRVIGDGESRPEIEAKIKELDLTQNVKLLGYLSHLVYKEELNRAHILVAPSVTAQDGNSEGGAPTVILEAQACGLPIVSTYHADIPNIVLEDKSALLVPERNAKLLAEKIVWLLEHPERWEEMGLAGRKYIKEKHNIDRGIDNLEVKYQKLMERIKVFREGGL